MTKKSTRRFFALLVAVVATCSQADAATMRLSLSDALKMAHERNTMLKAARAKNDQADARVVQSRQAYLPKVTLSETLLHSNDPGAVLVGKLQQEIAYYNFNTTPPDFGDFSLHNLNHPSAITDFHTSLQVQQPIYNRDAIIGGKMARSARKAQGFMTDRAVESIDLNVKKAFYGLILAKKNLDAIEQSIRIMQGYSSEAARGYAAGLVTKSDKLSTEVRLAELRDQKLQIQDAIRNAQDALRTILALGPDDTIQPIGDLAVDARIPASAAKASAEGRSDLKALAAFQEVAGYQHDMARAQYLPRVNAFAQQNWHDSSFLGTEGSSWTIGLNVQWNIFDGMATKGKVQETKAQELEARYNYQAAKEQSEMEIDMARRALVTSRERIAVTQKSLEAAKVSFDFIGEQFRTGMAMTFELLMREQAWTWAKMSLNQAKYDYCIAKSELEYYSAH
ncbi:MAG TPA: transporter [Chlorobaculum sp.]|jgi:outer membrane protein TolC|uniref:LipD protein, putative n=1 Tax=Chlorobaculum tepidum (strain ATCC 49652 / DSM 12025 / NBRC 103806 / TLS) TaxID=194439 RepID=Q8KAV2_CHLTE|nr:TolC family protein [Chlorobaculum tepidum]AAM73266.1 lipD protein, putative [Chlorobaculum tepidum TLS]HBU23380.1 transporter [Chlorobaculum sp.]